MDIYIKLQDLLDEKKISQRQLAKRTGIRQAFISDFSNNKIDHLPLKNLVKICEELECSIDQIIELKKEPAE